MVVFLHRPLRTVGLILLAGLLLLPAGGCSGKSGPKLYPVTGSIKLGDKPMSKGSMAFNPDKAKGNTSTLVPSADIAEDGTFTVYTSGKPGAPLGWYKVTVISAVPVNPKDPYSETKSLINVKYNTVDTTDLSVEVVEAPKTYELKLSK